MGRLLPVQWGGYYWFNGEAITGSMGGLLPVQWGGYYMINWGDYYWFSITGTIIVSSQCVVLGWNLSTFIALATRQN